MHLDLSDSESYVIQVSVADENGHRQDIGWISQSEIPAGMSEPKGCLFVTKHLWSAMCVVRSEASVMFNAECTWTGLALPIFNGASTEVSFG